MKRKLLLVLIVTVLVTTLVLSSAVYAAVINNGGLETGDKTGWQTWNSGYPGGDWGVFSGAPIWLPGPGFNFAQPEGNFAAVTFQDGYGEHVMYQDIVLEPFEVIEVSAQVYYENWAGIFDANQMYTVDLIYPGAHPASMATDDIIMTLFRTLPGDPMALGPTIVSSGEVKNFSEESLIVRLRFYERDSYLWFNASFDDVQLSTRLLTKAEILQDSGVPGKGLDTARGLQKPFNPKSHAAENAGKKPPAYAQGKNSRGSIKVELVEVEWEVNPTPPPQFILFPGEVVGSVILNATASGKLIANVNIDNEPGLEDYDVIIRVFYSLPAVPPPDVIEIFDDILTTNIKGQGNAQVVVDISPPATNDSIWIILAVREGPTEPPTPPDFILMPQPVEVPLK